MNPIVQKYAPPIVVLGAALYWGWPPAEPMDLGEDLVKARAVRWKATDLESPTAPDVIVDPFRPVLVAKEAAKPVVAVTKESVGPSEDQIRGAVKLTGIANMGGRRWAIVNGKAHLAGDTLRTRDKEVKVCKLVVIHPEEIVVQCEQTFAVIRPQVSRKATKNTSASPAKVTPTQQTNQDAPPPDSGPPPQDSI